jgi:quercetin dioxygenase-like cupin family protein
MRSWYRFLLLPALAVIGASVLFEPAAAQYGQTSSATLQQSEWENNRLRLRRIAVEPGTSARAEGSADRVLIYLTANQDGNMPEAEAVWQPAGSPDWQNRGPRPLEAIAIDLKGAPSGATSGTPPEALNTPYRAETKTLIDNARILVTKHRYAPTTFVDPPHFHPDDMLVVYLQGGYTWPVLGGGWGAYRVRRGEVDVVPANSLHTLGNAGSDPLEFLVILPR